MRRALWRPEESRLFWCSRRRPRRGSRCANALDYWQGAASPRLALRATANSSDVEHAAASCHCHGRKLNASSVGPRGQLTSEPSRDWSSETITPDGIGGGLRSNQGGVGSPFDRRNSGLNSREAYRDPESHSAVTMT
jgi:hypothetical protein